MKNEKNSKNDQKCQKVNKNCQIQILTVNNQFYYKMKKFMKIL